MDVWNPDQYQKFQQERAQPFWDLAAKIDFTKVHTMLDIGCGTGEMTEALHRGRNIAATIGIDSSEQMLQKARPFAGAGLGFKVSKVEEFEPPQTFDVVISNAALQWVDNHPLIFPRIFNWITPGGQLAVQMPVNFDHPSHLLADELAREFKLKPRQSPVMIPEDYASMFYHYGLKEIDVSVKVYLHPMDSALGVVEWTKGTLLTHYQKQMPPEQYTEFLKIYSERLVARLGTGKYLYPFKRLFLKAVNPKKLQ